MNLMQKNASQNWTLEATYVAAILDIFAYIIN